MVQKIFTSVLFLLIVSFTFGQTGEIQGKITDSSTGEGIPFANVVLDMNGNQKGGAQTDFNGNYSIKPITPGAYDIKVTYVGYQPSTTTGVVVSADKITFLDITMNAGIQLDVVEIIEYEVPLISEDNTTSGQTITSEDIENLPTRNVNSVAASTAGIAQADEGGSLNVRGSRSSANVYYIDGIKVVGDPNIPQSAIEQITVATGGLSAKYGDALGGVINITTKGPSNEFHGGLEVLTSEFLDDFGYNLATANISGPIMKKQADGFEKTVLGFFISGEAKIHSDPQASAVGVYTLKDDVFNQIKSDPFFVTPNGNTDLRLDYVTKDDIDILGANSNTELTEYKGTAKLDLAVTDDVNLTFGGSLRTGDNPIYLFSRTLFNYENNPVFDFDEWRTFGRVTHQLISGDRENNTSLLSSAYYSLQFDYSKQKNQRTHSGHDDNLWDYGYYGQYQDLRNDVLTPISGGRYILSKQAAGVDYTPGSINQEFSVYPTSYLNNGGTDPNSVRSKPTAYYVNGQAPTNVERVFDNWGFPAQNFTKNENDQYRLTFSTSVDLKSPEATDRNKHALEFGFEYEQRVNRFYSLNPLSLWTQARNLTRDNQPFQATGDTTSWVQLNDTTWYFPANSDFTNFEGNIRNALGINGLDQFVDIDALSPDQMDISFFSADELLNGGSRLVGYSGYDVYGNKTDSKYSYDDYNNAMDGDNRTRPIDAYRPIYAAAYLQDKFAFNDLIFNIGVRVDRFDANIPVLKDPYVAFDTHKAGELGFATPSNIGDDFVVYVNDGDTEFGDVSQASDVKFYRDGDIWYSSTGSQIANVSDNSVFPLITSDARAFKDDPQLIDVNAFEDYDPQIDILPRIAFSFPISEEALFYAHYDVLAARPTNRSFNSPYRYQFWSGVTTLNNANLKSQKTVDYEIGFKQKISNSSALSLAAYYREFKDQIQINEVRRAFNSRGQTSGYNTYLNQDFGTVKGLTIGYDLRRTGNVRLNLNYTLQYADGTGSNDRSAATLTALNQDPVRNIFPLDFDQRHTINASIDYRFGEGKDYDGPRWFNSDFLSNFGVNARLTNYSGRPYSRIREPFDFISNDRRNRKLIGEINGSRMPWASRLDIKVDKDFRISNTKPVYFNLYLQAQNVLDAENILGVYEFTGSANDDGFLASPIGQGNINSAENPQTYIDVYQINLLRKGNYSLPRTLRLGGSFSF